MGVAVAVPLAVKHPDWDAAAVTVGLFAELTVAVCMAEHPFESVTVTVHVPEQSPEAVMEVCPVFQL